VACLFVYYFETLNLQAEVIDSLLFTFIILNYETLENMLFLVDLKASVHQGDPTQGPVQRLCLYPGGRCLAKPTMVSSNFCNLVENVSQEPD
jgi:hypothetical protein